MDESNLSLSDYYAAIKAEHEANNAWSAEQAEKAQAYQTEMSNTAHQREVADLKAAGLNPVLSAGGSGATTGSGIAAQRDDSNVNAIYGLLKEAFKVNLEQSKAMQNTAYYISGGAGYSDPISILEKANSKVSSGLKSDRREGEKVTSETVKNIAQEVFDAMARGASDVAKGKVSAKTVQDLGYAALHVVQARNSPDIKKNVLLAPGGAAEAAILQGLYNAFGKELVDSRRWYNMNNKKK